MQIFLAIIVFSCLAGFLIRTFNFPEEIALLLACTGIGIVFYYSSTKGKGSYEKTKEFFNKINNKKNIYVKSLVYIGTGFIVLSLILYTIYAANKYFKSVQFGSKAVY